MHEPPKEPQKPPPEVLVVKPLRPTIAAKSAHPSFAEVTKGFSCAAPGREETRWERYVSSWITAPEGGGGAIDAMLAGTTIYLYFKNDKFGAENLVGFSSLGVQLIRNDDGVVVVERRLTIPCLGVSTAFRGQVVPRNERFGVRIFSNILEIAERKKRKHNHVFLDVDPENPIRYSFYPSFGFVEVGEYEEDGERWIVMARRLGG